MNNSDSPYAERQRLSDEEFERAREHPRYSEFQDWMVANQGGARKCPAGNFPDSFNFWLNGGRW
jgi:hypothetical protein